MFAHSGDHGEVPAQELAPHFLTSWEHLLAAVVAPVILGVFVLRKRRKAAQVRVNRRRN
ncbi:MAG: hypothetical protein ACQCXQ_07215 [Verrucomicrobiales bacterium]|nr:hypothetical protein [Verrucomicrobiota bacterium JB025]